MVGVRIDSKALGAPRLRIFRAQRRLLDQQRQRHLRDIRFDSGESLRVRVHV